MKYEERRNKKKETRKRKAERRDKREERRREKVEAEKRKTKDKKWPPRKLWGLRAVSITGEDLKKGGEIESFFLALIAVVFFVFLFKIHLCQQKHREILFLDFLVVIVLF